MTPEQTTLVITTLARIDERLKNLNEQKDDHEGRLRTIEKRQWGLFGGASLFAASAAFVSRYWEKLIS